MSEGPPGVLPNGFEALFCLSYALTVDEDGLKGIDVDGPPGVCRLSFFSSSYGFPGVIPCVWEGGPPGVPDSVNDSGMEKFSL